MSSVLWLLSQPALAGEGAWWLPGTFWMPPAASDYAQQVDQVFYFIYWTCVAFFIVLMGATAFFLVAYRKRSDADKTHPTHGNTQLEIAWAVLPSFLLVWMFWIGWVTFMDLQVAPANSLEIHVTGQKWAWSFDYPKEGVQVAGKTDGAWNPLVVPSGTPVKLRINSVDVLHSFFVPDFRIKKDAVPNRYSSLWFEAKEPGEHQVYCTEYCGDDHSRMLGKIKVVSAADFEKWVADQKKAGSTEGLAMHQAGEKLFAGKLGCAACHSVAGAAGVGPALNGKYGTEEDLADGTKALIDDNYVRNSVMDPGSQLVKGFGNMMPTFKGRITDDEMAQVIEYIKSIGKDAASYAPVEGAAAPADGGADAGTDAAPAAGDGAAIDMADPVKAGEALFNGSGACMACHSVDGSPRVGPSLKDKVGIEEALEGGTKVLFDKAYFVESVHNPNAKVVKGFAPAMTPRPDLTPEQLDALYAYLSSISSHASAGGAQ